VQGIGGGGGRREEDCCLKKKKRKEFQNIKLRKTGVASREKTIEKGESKNPPNTARARKAGAKKEQKKVGGEKKASRGGERHQIIPHPQPAKKKLVDATMN